MIVRFCPCRKEANGSAEILDMSKLDADEEFAGVLVGDGANPFVPLLPLMLDMKC